MGPFEGPDRDQALSRFVSKDTIRLGCTPVMNLFEGDPNPIRLNQRRAEYLAPGPGVQGIPPGGLLGGSGQRRHPQRPTADPLRALLLLPAPASGVRSADCSGTNGDIPAPGCPGEPPM